jgi:hypothetical protein
MFNKKQNVEDDFMGYNTNSSEQAKEKSGGLGSIIQFLIVLILLGVIAVGGMFGYKYIQKDLPVQSLDLAKSKQPTEVKQVAITKTNEVHTDKQQKMYTQEQVEDMVKILMAKMQSTSKPAELEDDGNNLAQSLNNIQVDQINDLVVNNLDAADTNKVVNTSSNDKVDRYNKVTLDNTNSNLNDLASQINSTINDLDQTNSKESEYTQSISNELSTRENEMRVIVVREGESLSLIAKRAYGNAMDYPILMKANPDLLKNPNRIYVGQRLRAPLIN